MHDIKIRNNDLYVDNEIFEINENFEEAMPLEETVSKEIAVVKRGAVMPRGNFYDNMHSNISSIESAQKALKHKLNLERSDVFGKAYRLISKITGKEELSEEFLFEMQLSNAIDIGGNLNYLVGYSKLLLDYLSHQSNQRSLSAEANAKRLHEIKQEIPKASENVEEKLQYAKTKKLGKGLGPALVDYRNATRQAGLLKLEEKKITESLTYFEKEYAFFEALEKTFDRTTSNSECMLAENHRLIQTLKDSYQAYIAMIDQHQAANVLSSQLDGLEKQTGRVYGLLSQSIKGVAKIAKDSTFDKIYKSTDSNYRHVLDQIETSEVIKNIGKNVDAMVN